MKSGTFTNNTSFSVTAASVNVPTGSIHIHDSTFTPPKNVRVVKVYSGKTGNITDETTGEYYAYVGVTPEKSYSLTSGHLVYLPEGDPGRAEPVGRALSSGYTFWFQETTNYDDFDWSGSYDFTIEWSPEINEMTPTYTDY